MLSSHLTAHLVPGHWKEEGASVQVPRFWCAFPLLTQWPHLCLLPFWRQLPPTLYMFIIDSGESSGDDATFSCSKTSLFFRKKEEKQFSHEYLVTGEFNIKGFFSLETLSLFLLAVFLWLLLSWLSQRNILERVSHVHINWDFCHHFSAAEDLQITVLSGCWT